MKNKTSKIVSAVYFVCILSSILLSVYLVSNVWARYFTEATGNDSARVAKFDVSAVAAEEQSNNLQITQETTAVTYSFSATSRSEVAVAYEIVLTLPEALPEGISIVIDSVEPTLDSASLVYTFSTAEFAFSANGGTNTHTLTITNNGYMGMVEFNDIRLEVVAVQVN